MDCPAEYLCQTSRFQSACFFSTMVTKLAGFRDRLRSPPSILASVLSTGFTFSSAAEFTAFMSVSKNLHRTISFEAAQVRFKLHCLHHAPVDREDRHLFLFLVINRHRIHVGDMIVPRGRMIPAREHRMKRHAAAVF